VSSNTAGCSSGSDLYVRCVSSNTAGCSSGSDLCARYSSYTAAPMCEL